MNPNVRKWRTNQCTTYFYSPDLEGDIDMKMPIGPGDLTPEWLTEALYEGRAINQVSVTSVATQIMGDEEGLTGSGQMARLHLTYDRAEADAPRSLIAKLSSPDPILRAEYHAHEVYTREGGNGLVCASA
jgi:hypothetical protein